jgi:hypothetical protein
MQRCWERWERAMIATADGGDGGYQCLRMFRPELVAECAHDLAAAEFAAGSDTEKVKARVAFARKGFPFTEAWTRMRLHAGRQEWEAAVAAGKEAVFRVKETEGTEPQAFFVSIAISQTETMIKAYREGRAATP